MARHTNNQKNSTVMAHFLRVVFDDGGVEYVNLDMVINVDVDNYKITLCGGKEYEFDAELDKSEWNTIMNFVRRYGV